MVDGGTFRLDETARPVGPMAVPEPVPPIFNPPVRNRVPALLGLGLVFVLVGAVLLVLMALDTNARGEAVVIGPAPGTDRVVVRVLDGPRPGRWRVSWANDLQPGEHTSVYLEGACGCVPTGTAAPRLQLLLPSVLVLLFGVLLVRAAMTLRAFLRGMKASALVLVPHHPADPVHITPVWSKVGRWRIGFAFGFQAPDGSTAQFHTAPMTNGRQTTRLDPTAAFSLVRPDGPDDAPALISATPPQAQLALRRLQRPGDKHWYEPHPASPKINEILGWSGGSPERERTHDLAEAARSVRGRWKRIIWGFVVVVVLGWLAPNVIGDSVPFAAYMLGYIVLMTVVLVGGARWARAPLRMAVGRLEGGTASNAGFLTSCLLLGGIDVVGSHPAPAIVPGGASSMSTRYEMSPSHSNLPPPPPPPPVPPSAPADAWAPSPPVASSVPTDPWPPPPPRPTPPAP